jgi:hypothetical protein
MKKNLLILNFVGLFLFFLFFGTTHVKSQIYIQPKDVTVCTGIATIEFGVAVEGLFPTYQWYVWDGRAWVALIDNSTNYKSPGITGSTARIISFSFGKPFVSLTTSFSGTTVLCKVTIGKTTYTSLPGVATVIASPSITLNPLSLDLVEGQPASFSIGASGVGLAYQWQISYDGGINYYDISLANSTSYGIGSVTAKDVGTYRCVVTNGCASRISAGAVLNVYPVLTIIKDPGKFTTCEGNLASFSVEAPGATGYQWQFSYTKGELWEDLKDGLNDYKYTTTQKVTPDMSGWLFRCIVYGGAGQSLASRAGILYVNSMVSIYGNPADASKIAGESVTFNVSASGYNPSFQWQFNKADIKGANATSYTIPNVQLSDAGSYRCVVTGGCKNIATSLDAILLVSAPSYPNGWVKQTSGSGLNILDVFPLSENIAWAVTSDQDKVLYTTNGGTNWSSIITGYNYGYWQSLFFTSASTGMVGGSNGITMTTNSGVNWAYTDWRTIFGIASTNNFYIYNIYFSDASNGWFVGSGGIIAKTINGGTTWTKVSFKTDASPVTDVDLYSVYFVDANIGFVSGASGKMFKTINGGSNWSELTTGTTGYIKDMAFTSSSTGYFVTTGVGKGVFKTTNGGTIWTLATPANVNSYIYPISVDFTDANNGWIAGYMFEGSQKVAIMKTYDAGLHWVTQKTTDLGYLNKIRMFSADHGWAVGSGGLILRTGKGGCYDPVVSLYADQTLCANQNYTLRADTFSNNYNSRYLWSTAATTGSILVNTTADYSVTITNECGKTATDNATITFLPLPLVNAGSDVSICEGQSTQLIATGGTTYSWNNGTYLNDNAVSNPLATPPTGVATTFTVTVTDTSGCSNTDAVVVTVNPLPTSDFTAPAFLCGTGIGEFLYSGLLSVGKTFAWDFSGGSIISGSGTGAVKANWNDLGDKLVSLTTTENGCSSLPAIKIINVREKPTSDFNAPATTCGSSPALLYYTGSAPSDATYSWGINGGTITSGAGQGPLQLSWDTPGAKALSLIVTQNECVSDITNRDIIVAYPYEGEQICLVTIDLETGKNMVVWERTHNVGIASYNVYREKDGQAGAYDVIGSVNFNDIPIFVDLSSNPKNRQYLYKISAVDTCGNESSLSKYHKTVFLQYAGTTSGINLSWEKYEIEGGAANISGYAIFKGSDSTKLAEFTTVSTSVKVYTDTDPAALTNKTYYRIGGVLNNQCNPAEIAGKKASSGPFVHSLSNLEDNRLQGTIGVSNVIASAFNLNIYPSPFTDVATINYNLQKTTKMKVEIYNVVGEKIGVLLDENQSAGTHKLEMKAVDVNYTNGLYYLRFTIDNAVIVRKTMLTR